ncbi:hypothetical protein WOLCODRAFT_135755 [Wolfiporia cocos MD-104 SS10]|uniref:Cyclin N-terminal domain-containing protein n=1 Tax=Wolfiporia cocos (strain MD-104) TaxID=742152 RepID=A0A2H3JLW8_WOLCO|nr:hypothetical protein WOLCODRAFT_135755 [Wolfiporia cocos MD-104 SS10]
MAASIHHASLVDPALHSPALLQLIKVDLSRSFIEYIVDCVVETVDYALGRPSSSTRGRSLARHSEHAKFAAFVADVVHRAEVKVPALLVTLVYIHRAKPHLSIALEEWACERVFLGALIVANKYTNDSTLKNVHWGMCSGVFGKRDIGRIEREFLDVLDWELAISEPDLLSLHPDITALARPRHHARAHLHAPAPRARSPARPTSRWSTDSSDPEMELDDSESSSEPVSSPRTPADCAPVPSAPAKHAALAAGPAPMYVVLPTPPPAHVAPVYRQPEPQDHQRPHPLPHARTQPLAQQPHPRAHSHSRMHSALQMLHLPLPYFDRRAFRPPPVAQIVA